MKKVFLLLSTLLITSTLAISMAVPALACHYDTVLAISVDATEVSPGDSVTLTIIDTFSGDTALTSPYVEIYVNDETVPGNLIATLDRSNGYVSGDIGVYDQMDVNGEAWQWQYTTGPITEDVTFIAIGYATDYLGALFTSLTERGEVSVTVEDGEGFTPGFWKNHYLEEGPIGNAWLPTGYEIGDFFDEVFGVGDHISLLGALERGGGGDYALARHAVAALLNAAHPEVEYAFSVDEVISMVAAAYGTPDWEDVKDDLEEQNELEGDITS